VEEHSYIVLGLAAFALARSRVNAWRVCIGLAVICMLWGVYLTLRFDGDYYDVYWRSDTRASAILLGCGFHCLAVEEPQAFEWIRGTTLLLMLGLVLTLSLGRISDCVKYTLGTTVLALCMARIESLPAFFKQVLTSRPLVYAGMASFSLYLYQQPFYRSDLRAQTNLLMLAAAVAAGLVSYHLIEKPARRTLNELYSRTSLAGVRRAD
jgi:peptidoglycan/LPS O-acetylase OafA/YrhL